MHTQPRSTHMHANTHQGVEIICKSEMLVDAEWELNCLFHWFSRRLCHPAERWDATAEGADVQLLVIIDVLRWSGDWYSGWGKHHGTHLDLWRSWWHVFVHFSCRYGK